MYFYTLSIQENHFLENCIKSYTLSIYLQIVSEVLYVSRFIVAPSVSIPTYGIYGSSNKSNRSTGQDGNLSRQPEIATEIALLQGSNVKKVQICNCCMQTSTSSKQWYITYQSVVHSLLQFPHQIINILSSIQCSRI